MSDEPHVMLPLVVVRNLAHALDNLARESAHMRDLINTLLTQSSPADNDRPRPQH